MLEGLAEIRQGNLLIVPGMCQLPAANDWLGQSYQYWAPLVFQSPFCKVNPSLPLPTGRHCCPRAARLLSTVHHNPLVPGKDKRLPNHGTETSPKYCIRLGPRSSSLRGETALLAKLQEASTASVL